jgi:hypothetical protein
MLYVFNRGNSVHISWNASETVNPRAKARSGTRGLTTLVSTLFAR